jgi:Ca-activated chloride channel family protein
VSGLETFHFIRPGAWLLLIPAGLVLWSVLRRHDAEQSWRTVIEPHLLKHLVVRREESAGRLRPVLLLGLGWLLAIFTLAGPSWEREATPFTEDQAAMFFVLKVTPEMLAQDIQPSRLQRAAQKIDDLLALRPGARAGLIAYADSAHLVMPLTTDPAIISYFAAELSPDVMPPPVEGRRGDALVTALEQAGRRLQAAGLPGSIVLLADNADPAAAAALDGLRRSFGFDVHVLAMAAGPEVAPPPDSPPAPALDERAMKQLARVVGGSLVRVTPDDSDVRQLNRQIGHSMASAPLQEGERWRDAGYFLLPLFALMVLIFFRRGGAVVLRV